MTSFARKLKRKQSMGFMKEFKKSMRKFKKLVKCSVCHREPVTGENIDGWHINKYSEKIDLVCADCKESEGGENEDSVIV